MAGIGSSIVSLLTIWLAFPTWGLIVYPELATFPAWAEALKYGTVPKALPASGSLQLLANVTNAIVNGTMH